MNGLLYLIIGSPNSCRLDTIAKSLDTNSVDCPSCVILPPEANSKEIPHSNWSWEEKTSSFNFKFGDEFLEYFLFFSNELELAGQIEATIATLANHPTLELARIVSFVDCNLLSEDIYPWLDGVAHFSDAMCFANRTNANGSLATEAIERYKSMRYPMETFFLSKCKDPPLNRILATTARRISHVFDPTDLLADDETFDRDPYLERLPNGNRVRPIPILKE